MHIHRVFEKLREEMLLINLKKCVKELSNMVFVVSIKGLKKDPDKVKAILE